MAHPESNTIPVDLDPPPSYDYVMKMQEIKTQPLPPPPQPSVPTHHLHQGIQQDPNQYGRNYIPHENLYQIHLFHRRNQDPSNMQNLILLYIVGFLDMVTAAVLIVNMSDVITAKANENKDHDLVILEYAMILSFHIIKFTMGAVLIVGLRTVNDAAKIVCFQFWIHGALLLICKDLYLLFGTIFEFSSVGSNRKGRLGVLVYVFNILFRGLWASSMRKHVSFLRDKLAFQKHLMEIGSQVAMENMMQQFQAPARVFPAQTKA